MQKSRTLDAAVHLVRTNRPEDISALKSISRKGPGIRAMAFATTIAAAGLLSACSGTSSQSEPKAQNPEQSHSSTSTATCVMTVPTDGELMTAIPSLHPLTIIYAEKPGAQAQFRQSVVVSNGSEVTNYTNGAVTSTESFAGSGSQFIKLTKSGTQIYYFGVLGIAATPSQVKALYDQGVTALVYSEQKGSLYMWPEPIRAQHTVQECTLAFRQAPFSSTINVQFGIANSIS